MLVEQTAAPGLVDNGLVTAGGGREDRPDPEVPAKARRRSFTAAYKMRILAEYEAATAPGAKGAILRRERLYSAHIVEWRKLRDEGALAGLSKAKGRPPTDSRDTENAALKAENERLRKELAKAQFVIDVQGKLHALLETLSESAPEDDPGPNSSKKSSG
jgi:transposase